MKKFLVKKISDLFSPSKELDVYGVLDALGDPAIRKAWLYDVLLEIKTISLSIDQKLSNGGILSGEVLADLSARRRALQFVLESALSIKRDIQRSRGHNPETLGNFDLESVTVEAGL